MKLNFSTPAALAFTVALALPSLAMAAPVPQANSDSSPQPVATLQVGGGVVMLSNQGSPFASGQSDDALYSGERLMVSNNSSATVVYHDGCQQTYTKPGVYVVDSGCKAAAAAKPIAGITSPTTGTLTTRPIGVWIGAAAITGAGIASIANKDQKRCPPVSH